MKTNPILFLMLLLVVSCAKEKREAIASYSDYEKYITFSRSVSPDSKSEEFKFWRGRVEKNKNDETSILKLAGLFAERFKASGQIEDIQASDSLYNHVLKNTPGGSVDIYHCLAMNAITQHKFRLANDYTKRALAMKDRLAATLLIQTDVCLELGDHAKATLLLNDFKNKNSFAYLIREAKVKDHEGKLDTAILLMEKASCRVKGNKGLSQWALTNTADMYGHAGRVNEAYQTYLQVLKEHPDDDYALKGIAWIALSYDHNIADAKKIIEALASRKRMPEAYLMLAEIAAIEGDKAAEMKLLKKFTSMVSGADYKTMYHKYLANIEAEQFKNPEACISIAEQEILNRPTPQSYDLLAWGYYHKQDFEKALNIAKNKVEFQTFEPDAFYHLGMIYLASGNTTKARYYLKEASSSAFELGPSISKKVNTTLSTL